MVIEKIKSHKLPGIFQISSELIKTVSRKIRCEIHKITISVWNMEELSEVQKESVLVPIYK